MTYPTDSPFEASRRCTHWAARSTGGEFTLGSEVDELIGYRFP